MRMDKKCVVVSIWPRLVRRPGRDAVRAIAVLGRSSDWEKRR
jgi:hypothetical protein